METTPIHEGLATIRTPPILHYLHGGYDMPSFRDVAQRLEESDLLEMRLRANPARSLPSVIGASQRGCDVGTSRSRQSEDCITNRKPQYLACVRPSFRIANVTQHLVTLCNESQDPIFDFLSNIAQQQRARKEIVIAWGLQCRASDQVRNSRRVILIFCKLKS
jgi:hypothetical protein